MRRACLASLLRAGAARRASAGRDDRRERGFTLVELMVVLAMVGILSALAITSLDTQARPEDGAAVVANFAREAGRQAVGRGPLEPDVAAALGTAAPARVRLEVDGEEARVALDVVEDGDWIELAGQRLAGRHGLEGWTTRAVLDDGGAPEELAGGAPLLVHCFADGICEGGTVYFAGSRGKQARAVVMPLGGSPLVLNRW